MSAFAPPPSGGGGLTAAQVLAALYPAPHVVTAAGASQVLTFDAGARETTWDVTMAANTVFSVDMTNAQAGSTITLYLRQDSTAGRTPTLPLSASPNGYSPTLNTASGKYDAVQLYCPAATSVALSVIGLGLQTPTAPAAPNVTVTPASGQNTLTITDGAANGSPITSHNLYRSTTAGAETLVGAITLQSNGIYTDTGLTNGTTYYYKISAVNAVGESVLGAEASGLPVANAAPVHYLNLPSNGGSAYTSTSSGNRTSTGFIDALAYVNLVGYAATNGTMNLVCDYSPTASGNNQSWQMFLTSDGQLAFFAYDNTSAFVATGSVATVPSLSPSATTGIYLRGLINLSAASITSTLMVGGSAVAVAAGTSRFYTSTDGTTWTQLGATQTGLSQNGIRNGGSASTGPSIGTNDGQTSRNSPPIGKFYKVVVRDANGILFNPDFTVLTTGATSFADTAPSPNTYSLYQATIA